MSIFGVMLYLVMGTTVYLLLFKRKYMVEEQRVAPKLFMAAVCAFAVFIVSVGNGWVPIT